MSALAQFIAEAKARIPMSSVVGSRVVLKKAGRELTGLCVWHSDRKPSMTVNDEKGFAHCFACGGHADLVDWLTQVERLDWRETIERLAELSGLPVPERSAAAAERAKRIDGLRPTLEAVHGLMLRQMPERVMRWMVEKRGFARELIDAFGLGYAPASEDWLRGSLGRMGLGLDALTECGVMGQSDKGFRYVRMKHRLTIPIHDGQGRLIGHGGRALPVELLAAGEQVRGDAPKYLNSPETPLFDKSRVLFNLHRARAMVSLQSPPVVVEGYLDVMRLDGLELPAMAPMGTALTEAQLVALWRLHPCPVLMFDGDAAGQKAALRACDTALPGIGPGRSLKVALLPEGVDPDDLGKAEGRAGLDAVISTAMPMHDFVFGAVAGQMRRAA